MTFSLKSGQSEQLVAVEVMNSQFPSRVPVIAATYNLRRKKITVLLLHLLTLHFGIYHSVGLRATYVGHVQNCTKQSECYCKIALLKIHQCSVAIHEYNAQVLHTYVRASKAIISASAPKPKGHATGTMQ